MLKEALLNASLAIGFPQEVKVLDDDGKPTGEIKMISTGEGGTTGYLEWLGLNHPRTFAAMLSRVMPMQLNLKTNTSLKVTYKTVEETRLALKERGIEPSFVAEILKLEAPKRKT